MSTNYDDVLDQLYIAKQAIADVFLPVMRKYGPGTDERKDFLAVKEAVDVAIIDMENAALGSIADRMKAALPDIKAANKRLNTRAEELKKVQNTAKKFTKALGALEKAVSLFA